MLRPRHTLRAGAAALALLACARHEVDDAWPDASLDGGTPLVDGGESDALAAPDASPDSSPPVAVLDADGLDAAADAGMAPDVADAAGATAATRAALLLPERWTRLEAADDPFTDRPDQVACSSEAVAAELLGAERVLGVDTGDCNYLTATQPTQRALELGELVQVRLWHFELSAPEAAEAHVALRVGDVELLAERVPIPQPGGLIVKRVRMDRRIPAGTPALFHLHNHGANSWALVEVSTGP